MASAEAASPERPGWAALAGLRAVVAGFGPAGFAAADNLLHVGARVVVLEEDPARGEQEAELLEILGADMRRGPGMTADLPPDVDVLVLPSSWPDETPLLRAARERDVEVWSDAELAWRLRDEAAPWLVVAAPDDDPGADEIAMMSLRILDAAGLRAAPTTDLSRPIVESVMEPEPYAAVVVVLTADQLRHAPSLSPQSAVVLDAGTDPDLARGYHGVQVACIYDLADPDAEAAVREAEVVEGARAVGITLGTPPVSALGVVEELLADRAFLAERSTSAAELATLDDLADRDGSAAEPALVWHALAAAALTRAHGVPQAAVRDGLRRWATS